MKDRIEKGVTLAIVLMSISLSGCESSRSSYPNVNWADKNTAYVLFDVTDFDGTTSKHVVYTDMWQHEEYVLFQGKGAQAEIIYSAANERDTIALDYDYPLGPMIRTWNIANRHPIAWGEKGEMSAPLGSYSYQHFRLTDVSRECVGFFTEWDLKDDDPKLRNGKVLFGYYCAKPGAPLTRKDVKDLLDNIWIRGLNTRLDYRFQPVAPAGGTLASSEGALNFAKLGTGGDTGNPKFPFKMASYYQESNGNNENQPR